GRAPAARHPARDRRARHAVRDTTSRRVESEDLAAVGAGTVLAAGPARPAREVLGATGRIRAGDQLGPSGLPLRTTVTRGAARHLPLRDSHGSTPLPGRWRGRRSHVCSALAGRPTWGRPAPRAGVPDRPRAWRRTRRTDPDSRPGTAAGTVAPAPP